MQQRKFNAIPTDAIQWHTTKAHYHGNNSGTFTPADGIGTNSYRTYLFAMGRSIVKQPIKDKLLDDVACQMLDNAKLARARLCLQGFSYYSNYKHSLVLTHLGIYKDNGHNGFTIVNPETGELGYYTLRENRKVALG